MKKIEQILMLLAFLMAQAAFVSCSDDDDNNGSTGSDNELVTIDKDGKASNGGIFSAIDDQNFYLDYIKYTVESGHLVVSGYDEVGFKGEAKIVARIAYNGNTYEVLEIGRYAFDECEELASVTIPNGVVYINHDAFWGCSGLTSLTIPSSVDSIVSTAFSSCSGLTSIRVEEGNKNYDSRNNCNAIIETSTNKLITGCSKTVIPEGVTSIGDGAFYECSKLTAINIPNGVTSIGHEAFEDCIGLTSITIPSSVNFIGYSAFGYCSLTSIRCLSSIPPITEGNAFYSYYVDTYRTATLYVPKGSLEAYKSTGEWSGFENIVEE